MSSPLPLPQMLQEMILAKLPVEDLLRSRAVCKYWGIITTAKSFLQSYGASISCSSPWFLFIHSRSGFITAADSTGKPRGFHHVSWIPTSKNTAIVSTSHGLLLLLDKGPIRHARFIVVNPLTKTKKELPPLGLSCDQEIAYTEILCSPEDNSYKVFTMGVMKADKLSGVLYKMNINQPAGSRTRKFPKINGYKKPFMHVYSSTSGSWTSITGFPKGLMLPFCARTVSHQSFIDLDGILYCVANSPEGIGGTIARFDTNTMEWNPILITVPQRLLIQNIMVDNKGELMLVISDTHDGHFYRAGISERLQNLVIGVEIPIPGEILPEDEYVFGLMNVWGWWNALFFHVPMIQQNSKRGKKWNLNGWDMRSSIYQGGAPATEPRVRTWFLSLAGSGNYCDISMGVEPPVGAFICGAADLLKMVYTPSVRVP